MTNKKIALKLMNSLSNWGRWGKKDQLGTINFITPKKRVFSAGLAEEGISVSCARTIETSGRPDLKSQAMHYVADADEIRTLDFIGMIFHGRAMTHIDAPSHFYWKGKMYNGFAAGIGKGCDAEVLKNGIVTRGIFFDIPGKLVSAKDLDAAEKRTGIRMEPGDALLVRTGKGIGIDATPWLYEKQIAIIGSDTPHDAEYFHNICLTSMGLWILDNCDLEGLAKICKERRRNEFLLFIAPLRIKNVTGSPVNPIAIF